MCLCRVYSERRPFQAAAASAFTSGGGSSVSSSSSAPVLARKPSRSSGGSDQDALSMLTHNVPSVGRTRAAPVASATKW
jgi:hypothetical protein